VPDDVLASFFVPSVISVKLRDFSSCLNSLSPWHVKQCVLQQQAQPTKHFISHKAVKLLVVYSIPRT